MTIAEIMTAKLVTVEKNDTLERVKLIFDKFKFHHLLVLDEGKLVGVLSDRDLLRALSPHIGSASETAADRITLKTRVYQVMSTKLITVPTTMTVEVAANVMLEYHVSCLPVANDGHLEGIVSWRDFLRALVTVTKK